MTDAITIELGPDRTLHAVSRGEGPDLLLIHGALATGHDWLVSPFPRLFGEWRMTVVDRPGHGQSRRPRFDGTPRVQARQIRYGLRRLGIERPVIVGHSFGGLVALAYAEQFPDELAQLVLVAPIAFPEPRLLEHSLLAPRSIPFLGPALSNLGRATTDRPVLELIQRLMFSPASVPAYWKESFPYATILDPQSLVFEGEDAAAILPMAPAGTINVAAIETPTHVITGTADKIVQHKRQGKVLARLMPNARLTEVQGAGHMVHQTHPEAVAEAIREALASA